MASNSQREKVDRVIARQVLAARAGDQEAKQALIDGMQGLVNRFVESLLTRVHYASEEDMRQEANRALLDAIRWFDTTRGFRFSTYAADCVRRRLARQLQLRRNKPIGKSLNERWEEEHASNMERDRDPDGVAGNNRRADVLAIEDRAQEITEAKDVLQSLLSPLQRQVLWGYFEPEISSKGQLGKLAAPLADSNFRPNSERIATLAKSLELTEREVVDALQSAVLKPRASQEK